MTTWLLEQAEKVAIPLEHLRFVCTQTGLHRTVSVRVEHIPSGYFAECHEFHGVSRNRAKAILWLDEALRRGRVER